MDRRRFLATLGVVALPSAGCLAGDPSDPAETTRTSNTYTTANTTTTTRPCQNGGELIDEYVVKYDRLSGFHLTASKETVARGEQITFQMENVTYEDKMSGVKSKYTIHRETEAGWRDIFYPDDDNHPAYYDLGVTHPPGDGFTWELTFNRPGLAHDIEEGTGSLDVCTPLEPGHYRFVYWGITGDPGTGDGSEKYSVPGVRFSVSSA